MHCECRWYFGPIGTTLLLCNVLEPVDAELRGGAPRAQVRQHTAHREGGHEDCPVEIVVVDHHVDLPVQAPIVILQLQWPSIVIIIDPLHCNPVDAIPDVGTRQELRHPLDGLRIVAHVEAL